MVFLLSFFGGRGYLKIVKYWIIIYLFNYFFSCAFHLENDKNIKRVKKAHSHCIKLGRDKTISLTIESSVPHRRTQKQNLKKFASSMFPNPKVLPILLSLLCMLSTVPISSFPCHLSNGQKTKKKIDTRDCYPSDTEPPKPSNNLLLWMYIQNYIHTINIFIFSLLSREPW